MTLLTKKDVAYIIKRVFALQVMLNHCVKDVDTLDLCTRDLADIAGKAGGVYGLELMRSYLDRYSKFNSETPDGRTTEEENEKATD